ncbi:MAG: mycothiol system anti-sigma-R factor [Actinomycetes bacterium]
MLVQIHAYLDGTVDATFYSSFVEHLDECSPCLTEVRVEQTVRALIVRSCGGASAPETLRMQILTRIRATRLSE